MFQYNRLAQAKTAEDTPQNPTVTQPAASVAIPVQQTATTVTYAQPFRIPATLPTQPEVTASEQQQQFPKFCALCNLLEDNAQTITYTPKMVRFRGGSDGP